MNKKIIYFLCTGNSSRSQMAEGFGKQLLGDDYEVYSAGTEQHGLNPFAVQEMKEKGIDISTQTSDLIDTDLLNGATMVITLCGDAKDKCPMTPPNVQRLHWGFEDPAQVTGTQTEKLAAFRENRDGIELKIQNMNR